MIQKWPEIDNTVYRKKAHIKLKGGVDEIHVGKAEMMSNTHLEEAFFPLTITSAILISHLSASLYGWI
jgi:hypothetical protein